jgi:DNA-binding response OmpR family regulator
MDIILIHTDKKLVNLYGHKLSGQFTFDSAHDGLTGLRKINMHRPHMIISGDSLPYLSGMALLKYVRSHKKLHSVPFIFFSHGPIAFEAMQHAANDWINLNDHTPESVIDRLHGHFHMNRNLIKILKTHV